MNYIDGHPALPSKFQLGDVVRAKGQRGVVTGIMFRAAKVFYEVGGVVFESNDVAEPLKVVAMEDQK